jgi:hypothetical protein
LPILSISNLFLLPVEKSLWTRSKKSVLYRPHEVAFHVDFDRHVGSRLQEPGPRIRSVFWPSDDSAAAHRFDLVSDARFQLSTAPARTGDNNAPGGPIERPADRTITLADTTNTLIDAAIAYPGSKPSATIARCKSAQQLGV